MTASVPFTAGLINSFSSFGEAIGNGEAVWTTYVLPYMALMRDSSSRRSASASSSLSKYYLNAFFNGSIFLGFLVDLTVPRTL